MDPGTASRGLSILAALWLAAPAVATSNPAASELYQSLCAECHRADHLGAVGPALIPETLGRIKPQDALTAIMEGVPTNQMPPFADRLREQQAEGLVGYILTPVSETPRWDVAKMLASHRVLVDPSTLPDRPVHDSVPMNLFVVLEMGDQYATVVDGDRLGEGMARVTGRFPARRIPLDDYLEDFFSTNRTAWRSGRLATRETVR